jgi:hypothetical protein
MGQHMKNIRGLLTGVLCALSFSTVHAGPVIIAGTDADDHGSASGGVNSNGWEFMQRSFTSLGGAVTNGNKVIVCIGCNAGLATTAFNSAVAGASLAGWTTASLTTTTQITNFFNGTGTNNLNNTGIIYMPTVSGNVTGGITDAQLAIVNANGGALNTFLAVGGGLFTQEQGSSSLGYGWLTSLLPGLTFSTSVADDNSLRLSAQGSAQFPGLTDAELTAATPWHVWFSGTFGALQSLVTGNGNGVGGFNDTVVLGGGFAGGGGVIVCGTVGAPACEPAAVPIGSTLPIVLFGLFGTFVLRKKAKTH